MPKDLEDFNADELENYQRRLVMTFFKIRLAQHTGPLTLAILQRYSAESDKQMKGFFRQDLEFVARKFQCTFQRGKEGVNHLSCRIFQLIIVVDIQHLSRSLFIRIKSVFVDMVLRKENMSVTAVRWRKELQIKVETLQTRYGDVSTFPEVFEQLRQELPEIARIFGEDENSRLLTIFEAGRVDLEPQIEAKIKPYCQNQILDSGGCLFCKSPWYQDNPLEKDFKDFMEKKGFQTSEDLLKFLVWTFQKTFYESLLDFFRPIFPKM